MNDSGIECGYPQLVPNRADDFTPESAVPLSGLADQSIGNFLKDERSMIMRSQRKKRYSQKYRDSVVRQIVGQDATFLELRRKLDLTETELMDWIIDYVERLEQQVSIQSLDAPNREIDLLLVSQVKPERPNHPK